MKELDSNYSEPSMGKKKPSFFSKLLSSTSLKDDRIENEVTKLDTEKPGEVKQDEPTATETDDSILLTPTIDDSKSTTPISFKRSSTLSKISKGLPTLSFYRNSKNRISNTNPIMQLVAFAANDSHSKELQKNEIEDKMPPIRPWFDAEVVDHSNQDSIESMEIGGSDQANVAPIEGLPNIEGELKELFGLPINEEFVTGFID